MLTVRLTFASGFVLHILVDATDHLKDIAGVYNATSAEILGYEP